MIILLSFFQYAGFSIKHAFPSQNVIQGRQPNIFTDDTGFCFLKKYFQDVVFGFSTMFDNQLG